MRRLAAAAVAVTLAVTLAACSGDDGGSDAELPDLTMAPMAEGGPSLDLATLTGPAVVNLWATWCGPCRRELPAFQEVSASRPDVRFIGIDIGEDAAKAQAYLDELGVTFDQFVDEDGGLTDAIGAASLPVTMVIAADGSVATEHLGPMSVDELHDAIDALPTT
jgi:thiol-disulfide isomerase/thioredoxin